jgi:hypothetical protein
MAAFQGQVVKDEASVDEAPVADLVPSC